MNGLLILLLLIGVSSIKSQTIQETEDFIKQNCAIYTKGKGEVKFVEKSGRMFMAYLRSYDGITLGAVFPVDQLLDIVINENELDCCIILEGKFRNDSEVKNLFPDNEGKLSMMDGGILHITLTKECKSENIPSRLKKALLQYAKLNGAEAKSTAF